jgi:hypothetical protein
MARTPVRDARSEAEKAFKAVTTKKADLPPPAPFIPGARMILKKPAPDVIGGGHRSSDKIMRHDMRR